jgi:hypothetical protein
VEGTSPAAHLAAYGHLTYPDPYKRKPDVHDGNVRANIQGPFGAIRSQKKHICPILLPVQPRDAINLFQNSVSGSF